MEGTEYAAFFGTVAFAVAPLRIYPKSWQWDLT